MGGSGKTGFFQDFDSYEVSLKRKAFPGIIALLAFCISTSCFHSTETYVPQPERTDRELLFQVSTMRSLLAGAYSGEKTIEELRKRGDFGIGMVNGLDGEIVLLDGRFYQIKSDGQASRLPGMAKTPFAVVTYFDTDRAMSIEKTPEGSMPLKKILPTMIQDKNAFYAIKIRGEFLTVKVRSVPLQTKPYRRLSEVLKNDQKIYDLRHVKGTLVGFWFPVYSDGINVSGYHFHFISQNKKTGGHLLDCRLKRGRIEIDHTIRFQVELISEKKAN